MNCTVRRWKDMERWTADAVLAVLAGHEIRLGDVLRPRREVPDVGPDLGEWQPITIHFDGSVEARDRQAAFRGAMFAAYPGDLVFSKIDARNGAIAVVPSAFPKVVLTSEYPVHVPDGTRVDARFLGLLLRTPHFLSRLRGVASGTSGRKRVTPELFRDIPISLPDLAVQRRLVAAHETGAAEAARLEAEADTGETAATRAFEDALGLTAPPPLPKHFAHIARFSAIERWSHEGMLQDVLGVALTRESRFPSATLGEIGRVSYGIQKCPANRPRAFARPYLRVANVQRGILDLREIKTIEVPDEQMPALRLEVGDILMCEGNSFDLVGRGAMWEGQIPDCVHQNHILRVRVGRDRAIPEFVLACINCGHGQAYFRCRAKRTTNLASINSREVAGMPLPLPPLSLQMELVAALRAGTERARELRSRAAALRQAAWQAFGDGVFAGRSAPVPHADRA